MLVLISVSEWGDAKVIAARKVTSMNNSSDQIGNRTRYHPAFRAVLQPTAPPHAPIKGSALNNSLWIIFLEKTQISLTYKMVTQHNDPSSGLYVAIKLGKYLLPYGPEPFVFLLRKHVNTELYKNIIFPGVLLRLRNCSVAFNKEHRLEKNAQWRASWFVRLSRCYLEMNAQPILSSRRIRRVGHAARIEKNTYRVLVRKPKRRRLLERPCEHGR
jgi:hypothetical protein